MKLALSSQLSALSKGSCGDGRPARPSGAKLRPLCPGTNVAKFLHLQALSSRFYWKIIPCSGPPRSGRTLAFQALLSGSAQGQQRDLWRDAEPHREAEGSEAPVHIERSFL